MTTFCPINSLYFCVMLSALPQRFAHSYNSTDFSFLLVSCPQRRRTLCGTLDYLAPEMVSGISHDERVDHWTVGILCYEMLCGRPPFERDDPADTYACSRAVKYTFPSVISPLAQDLISQVCI